jgi:pectin methylesterase-like acyl-CoA thioesterase
VSSGSIIDEEVSRKFGFLFRTSFFTMIFSFNSKLVVVATSLISTAYGKDIYVSPSGTGSGSQAAPYGSIQAAINAAVAGDIILLRAGTYKPTTNIQIAKSGTDTSPITIRSYQEEKVILDGESLPG